MSQTKLSKSKSRILTKNLPSTDILHKGYQRQIAKSDYVKIFPKMRLRLNARGNINTVMKNQCTQQVMWEQIQNIKQENKKLQESNQELITKIRKESKFNEIYEKRMEGIDIDTLSLEKILEIKLLLQVQELEEAYQNKQQEMNKLLKANKKKKQQRQNETLGPHVELHAILLQNQKDVDIKRQCVDIKLRQTVDNLNTLSEKRQKIKKKHRQKGIELTNTNTSIEKQALVLPKNQENVQESSQNIILAGINRNRNIEELQAEIKKIQLESKELQIKVQQQIDNKVRAKLALLKDIQELATGMQKLKTFNKGQGLKVICW